MEKNIFYHIFYNFILFHLGLNLLSFWWDYGKNESVWEWNAEVNDKIFTDMHE